MKGPAARTRKRQLAPDNKENEDGGEGRRVFAMEEWSGRKDNIGFTELVGTFFLDK